jgi:hypothetical protein
MALANVVRILAANEKRTETQWVNMPAGLWERTSPILMNITKFDARERNLLSQIK